MSVIYAKGGGGLGNLFKLALSTFGGPVGKAASAAWSAAHGDPLGAVANGLGAAGVNPADVFRKFFWSRDFAAQVPRSAYDLGGWGPWSDTDPLGRVR